MEETKKETSVDDGTVDIELGEDTEAQSVEIDVVETPETEESGEHEEYSQGVKKRIDRLTKKMREAERQREEALLYAKNVKTESDQVKAKLNTVDQGYLNEYGGRITAESTAAKEAFKRAIAVGDPEGTLAAQTKLNELHYAETKLNEAKRAQTLNVQRQEQEQQQPQAQQPQQAPQEAPAKADPRAEKWAGTNEWFGNDNTMTFAAYGIHKQLVDEAFDPTGDDYYDELDKRIREEFPHKFSDTGTKRRNAQTVVGVSRSNSSQKGRRQVKLSPSQVAIATKLGVPLEEYAKYVK
jgi:DNA segregation ATPase FtsK/SpoIIIE-like protein|tara:strand:+ start:1222 stop:2109 length:888 start_codon:yes stop_codon:yes gene_type:complete